MKRKISLFLAIIMTLSFLFSSNVFASTSGGADTKTIYVSTKSNWWSWGSPSITLRQQQVDIEPLDKQYNPFTEKNAREIMSIYPSYSIKIKNITTGKTEGTKSWNSKEKKISLKDDCEYEITVKYSALSTGFGYSATAKFLNGTQPYWYISKSNKATYR